MKMTMPSTIFEPNLLLEEYSKISRAEREIHTP